MLNYNLPLTEAESEFAAEHHSVIYGYLRKAGLPEDDFYDVVVFGYLRAVRKYLARPELRKYSFFHHCLPGHELRCPPLQGVLDAQEAPCPGRVPG